MKNTRSKCAFLKVIALPFWDFVIENCDVSKGNLPKPNRIFNFNLNFITKSLQNLPIDRSNTKGSKIDRT